MITPSSVVSSEGMKIKKTPILVVDDNPTALHLLVNILGKENYDVTQATNGVEAMNALRHNQDGFDVILLDRMMPEMDGMKVTRIIQADSELKHIPIIMQTAADKPEQISEGIKAGVFYYLTKPIERKTLLSIVASAIKEVEQRKALRSEMLRHRISFGLIQVLKSSCKTLAEAEGLSSFLANCFPDPDRVLTGISEIITNAIEHGNLAISYDEKTELMEANDWREEVNRRLQLPEFTNREVSVIFEKKENTYYLQVTDQGKGFNWKSFLEFDPSRASHNHGRGIAMANMIAFDKLVYNEQGNQVTAVMEIQTNNTKSDNYWG